MYKTDPVELGARLDQLWQDQRAKNNLKAKSKRSFANSIGADASYFNRAVDGKGFSDDYITAVIKEYGVNEKWLRFGEGEMYGQTSPNSVPQGAEGGQQNTDKKTANITPKAWENLTESVLYLSQGIAQGQTNIANIVSMVKRETNSDDPLDNYSENEISELIHRLGQGLSEDKRIAGSPGKFVAYAMKVLKGLRGSVSPESQTEVKKATPHNVQV
jgi:hypothetical protein